MARFKQRHPETLCMHKMLWDAMRGVDLLESLPQVDASRIGAVGHSLGAIESLYLAAFDERVRVDGRQRSGAGLQFHQLARSLVFGSRHSQPLISS